MGLNGMTANEMQVILTLLKKPQHSFSANSLSKVLLLSPMGTHKIAKKLEREGIITKQLIGKSHILKIRDTTKYNNALLTFLLEREKQSAKPYTKAWIQNLDKIKNTSISILFGSILKTNQANDIDVLFVTNNLEKLTEELKELQLTSNKIIHPIIQSEADFKRNIQKQDPAILCAIQGMVLKGIPQYLEAII